MNTKQIKAEVVIHEHVIYTDGKRLQRNEIILNDEQYSYLLAQAERMEDLEQAKKES